MAKNKKLVNEAGLLKEGIRIGMVYAEKRGVVEFEATDSHSEKVEYLYRLLVHDRLIQPWPRWISPKKPWRTSWPYGSPNNYRNILCYEQSDFVLNSSVAEQR